MSIRATSGEQSNFNFLSAWPAVSMGNESVGDNMVETFVTPVSGIIISSGQQHTFQTFRPDQCPTSIQAGVEPESEQYDPVRVVFDTAPPKRFFRTFWRSAARRLLEHANSNIPTD